MNENDVAECRITLAQRIVRGLIGVGMGWFVVNLVCLFWCGVAIVWAGDLEVALNTLKANNPIFLPLFGSIFAGVANGFLAAPIATLVLGRSRVRYPVVKVSLASGVLAAIITSILGGGIMYGFADEFPKRFEVVFIPCLLLSPIAILCGWRVGRRFTDTKAA